VPEDGQYYRNMQHLLTRQIEFVVADGKMHVKFI